MIFFCPVYSLQKNFCHNCLMIDHLGVTAYLFSGNLSDPDPKEGKLHEPANYSPWVIRTWCYKWISWIMAVGSRLYGLPYWPCDHSFHLVQIFGFVSFPPFLIWPVAAAVQGLKLAKLYIQSWRWDMGRRYCCFYRRVHGYVINLLHLKLVLIYLYNRVLGLPFWSLKYIDVNI